MEVLTRNRRFVAQAGNLRCRRKLGVQTSGWLVLFCFWQFTVATVFGQVSKEYQFKAVLLWRLAQFTEWTTTSFEGAESPIVIGVLGEDPFGDSLELVVRGETAQGRKIVLRYYSRVNQIKTCHVLYISISERRRVREITAALAGRSILTVSDIDGFAASSGGMIGLITEQNKIKLRINLDAVTAARLKLDARLLRASEVVRTQ